MRVSPTSVGKIHFIGIGGIGMSGVADIMHNMGYAVQGSDLSANQNVKRLRDQGISVEIGHDKSHIDGASVIVISSAVNSDNPELKAALLLGLPVVRRAEMLAELMRLKPSVVISGTHGKTTTTSIIAELLEQSTFDPTVVSGGVIHSFGTNARLGEGEWMVVEADESDGTFIKLPATIGVITNIDPEHLDFYGSFKNLLEAFITFIENIPFYGLGIICIDNFELKKLLPQFNNRRIMTYGFNEKADVRAINLQYNLNQIVFDVVFSDKAQKLILDKMGSSLKELRRVEFSMIGEHNVQNALAAIAVSLELGVQSAPLIKGLKEFSGVNRRFTLIDQINDISIIDDYAHHPTEIEAVLRTARQVCSNNMIVVIQPHRYTRLSKLFKDYCGCFNAADAVIVTPVHAAGESPIVGIDHNLLAESLRQKGQAKIYTIDEEGELALLLQGLVEPGDFIVCLGAGSITNWAHRLPAELMQLKKSRRG